MRSARDCTILGLLALSIAAGPSVVAQEPGWYMGANLGRSKARLDEPKIVSGLLPITEKFSAIGTFLTRVIDYPD